MNMREYMLKVILNLYMDCKYICVHRAHDESIYYHELVKYGIIGYSTNIPSVEVVDITDVQFCGEVIIDEGNGVKRYYDIKYESKFEILVYNDEVGVLIIDKTCDEYEETFTRLNLDYINELNERI